MIELPEVIIQHILEFNPFHREKFKLIVDDLESKAAVMKCHIMTNAWNTMSHEERPSFYEFIIISGYIDDFQRYVKALHKCKCCARHQINKPEEYYDMEWDMEPDRPAQSEHGLVPKHNSCQCPCRHMARFCCISAQAVPLMN